MAKKRNIQNTSSSKSNSFIKGLNKDSDPLFVTDGMWTHARNAVNNTLEGDIGTLSNESSNELCAVAGATMLGTKHIIGVIHITSDKFAIFTVAYTGLQEEPSSNSEIGIFEETLCRYRTVVQDPCLNFSKLHLISGASKKEADCSRSIYFADGLNPDRYVNLGDPKNWPSEDFIYIGLSNPNYYTNGLDTILWPGAQWKQNCVVEDSCEICTNINQIDCEKIRLARLVKSPCLTLELSPGNGTLRNGSYFATIAYSIKGQRVTNYFSGSNVQPVYNPDSFAGSLDINVSADNENFEEFELVVVYTVNQQTVAKRIGNYSTNTTKIHLDQIKEDLTSIPLEIIPVNIPTVEKSDYITEVNDYLLRVGPTTRFDFNYQPLANLIRANWVSVEYPEDYYRNGGSNTSYLRDEVYAFFIRWVYNTGDKSSSYHIPGRYPEQFTTPIGTSVIENGAYSDDNSLTDDTKLFETYNTASVTSLTTSTLPDGGKIVARGRMGYWESTEVYPDNQPDVWNSTNHCWTGTVDERYNLCGKPIRHHKFPEGSTHLGGSTHHYTTVNGVSYIRIMGVTFSGIIYPKDNDGNDIPGIVGYEILRGSREGNKTVIAKGMINNFRPYRINKDNPNRLGLYPNYPYNTIKPLGVSNFNDPYVKVLDEDDELVNITSIPKDLLTFHSPDTSFRNPLLTVSELKLYGKMTGFSDQQFIVPEKHPEFKLLANASVLAMFIGGLMEAIVSMAGKRTYNVPTPPQIDTQLFGGNTLPSAGIAQPAVASTIITANTALEAYYNTGGYLIDAFSSIIGGYASTGQAIANNTIQAAINTQAVIPGSGFMPTPSYTGTTELPDFMYLPVGVRTLVGLEQALFYFSEGANLALELIYALLPYRDYALQMVSHGFYDTFLNPDTYIPGNNNTIKRFKVADSSYIKDNLLPVKKYNTINYRINNLKRSKTVFLRTEKGNGSQIGPNYITSGGVYLDQSLVTLGTSGVSNIFEEVQKEFRKSIASHYVGIKVRIDNLYGQLDSIKQIPISGCEQKFDYDTLAQVILTPTPDCNQIRQRVILNTPVFFGGDTYINRYTEKNTMFFFYDWLYEQPDGFEYNYLLRQMVPQPRFWANTQKYDASNLAPSNWFNPVPGTGALPKSFYNLDNENYDYTTDDQGNNPGLFGVKDSYFYLAVSGVRDFFVESDVLVDFRKQPDNLGEKHYDKVSYTDLYSMFNMNPSIITRGNYWEYDYSLSVSKLYTQYFSQGNLQNRYYNPNVAELCYTYYPERIIYSLQQQDESVKDSWFVYLANNYKQFSSTISAVKPFAKTGLFIAFKNSSPLIYQGVDTLQTDLGTKVTLGDGGLFSNPPQNVVVADKQYQYGSSTDKLSFISTPAGLVYVSQDQGKVFSFDSGLSEISQNGMKWWFNEFLPYKLLEDFPTFDVIDNPVAGIGCQSIYDNENSVFYFSKKDYKLRSQYQGRVTYNSENKKFILDELNQFNIGDPILFENASWTISYDPKAKFWISFHDWHPDLNIQSKDTFLTIKGNQIWKHNQSSNSYCNFYGIDYPFSVEMPIVTGQTVTTIKSVEYMLECYRRSNLNFVDQFHVLDYNFDQAVIYNSEQVSGYLNLNLQPKNNPTLALQYPRININSIDILYAKEENKYRFNQFWDITRDRGEFPIGSTYPPTGPVIPGTTILQGVTTQENIWVTEANGYVKTLNPNNLNYNKNSFERKKFRHYINFLHLEKRVSGNTNMILKIVNTKNQLSQR